jgi:ribosomal protein L7Ae-like RNA K-turn-binding protein
MTSKIYSFLGLATKAGRLISGEDACERAITGYKAALIIIAEDASENTKKHFSDMCKYRKITFRVFGTKELIGKCTGKGIRAVLAILDKEFTGQILRLIDVECIKYGGGLNG